MNESNESRQSEDSMHDLSGSASLLSRQLSLASQEFSDFLSLGTGMKHLISKTKEAILGLKEIDTLLAQISRTNASLSRHDLARIADSSFDISSRYGRTFTDYLSGVQKASLSGFDNAEEIAELSLLIQSAGGLDADLADSYLTASNAAYGYAGNIEKLNALLDLQSRTASQNSLSMEELARAAQTASGQLSASGMAEDEITALLGAGIKASGETGENVGRTAADIIANLKQVTKAAENPVQALKELSQTYQSLPDGSVEKADILSRIGGSAGGNVLDGILSNWDLYEKMLAGCADANGFAMQEAMKSADSWEGSLNRLSNTWADTIGNITDSNALPSVIDGLNAVLSAINKITETLGPAGSIGLGAGLSGIGAFAKNFA